MAHPQRREYPDVVLATSTRAAITTRQLSRAMKTGSCLMDNCLSRVRRSRRVDYAGFRAGDLLYGFPLIPKRGRQNRCRLRFAAASRLASADSEFNRWIRSRSHLIA